MKTPYDLLDISTNASDVEIKQAYLRKVKENPPDRDPQKFHLIHNAYLAIKDHKCRVSYDLFTFPTVNFDHFIDQALHIEQPIEITPEVFNELLRVSVE